MVRHPQEELNKKQEAMLKNCSPENRRFHELIFSFGNAIHQYHQQVNEFQPTVEEYNEWLEGLPERIMKDMKEIGFEGCKSVLSFTRYVMEKNDVGQEEYVRRLMGEEEYNEYKNLSGTKS